MLVEDNREPQLHKINIENTIYIWPDKYWVQTIFNLKIQIGYE